MRIVGVPLSLVWILLILWDGFEVMVLPRRVTHRFRFARLYFRTTWRLWSGLASRVTAGARREALYSVYGPLSLLSLFATWMAGLVLGYAALHWSLGTPLAGNSGPADFVTY